MLTVLIGLAAVAYTAAAAAGVRVLVCILKPGTMLLILALAAQGLAGPPVLSYGWCVAMALALSLVGDVCLMLRQDRFWLMGAGAFLAAHLLYIAAFFLGGMVRLTWLDGLTGVVLGAAGVWFVQTLARGLKRRGQTRLLAPVTVYAAVLSAMAWLAVGALGPDGVAAPVPGGRLLLVAAGGLLFYLSDLLLAVDRFVRPLRWRDLLVIGPYFAAQYLFALSVGWPV